MWLHGKTMPQHRHNYLAVSSAEESTGQRVFAHSSAVESADYRLVSGSSFVRWERRRRRLAGSSVKAQRASVEEARTKTDAKTVAAGTMFGPTVLDEHQIGAPTMTDDCIENRQRGSGYAYPNWCVQESLA
jgi:hypothetical protein